MMKRIDSVDEIKHTDDYSEMITVVAEVTSLTLPLL